MIKGVRVQANNTATLAPLLSAFGLLTLTGGKSFVLTDIVASFRPTLATGLGVAGVALMDKAFGAGVSAFTAGDVKVMYGGKQDIMVGTAVTNVSPGPIVLTDIQQGPSFSTCVTAGAVGTFAIPTYGIWIAGVLR